MAGMALCIHTCRLVTGRGHMPKVMTKGGHMSNGGHMTNGGHMRHMNNVGHGVT